MTGYRHVLELNRLQDRCSELGFRWAYPKFRGGDKDLVALYPKDHDALPCYSRDAELFVGTIEELKVWIRGVEWARTYDQLVLGPSYNLRLERKEQDIRNQNLVRKIKESS